MNRRIYGCKAEWCNSCSACVMPICGCMLVVRDLETLVIKGFLEKVPSSALESVVVCVDTQTAIFIDFMRFSFHSLHLSLFV